MFNWTDILDILAVSIPLHFGLRALAIKTHRRVVAYLFALAVLYLCAKEYDWALSSLFLQFLFAIGAIGIFVVFQEEIRRFLESVLHFGLGRPPVELPLAHSVQTVIIHSLNRLSDAKIGALIVLEKKQAVHRLTKGGVKLDGHLSVPLLLSLFDHHSDGHDGAVILSRGKVVRFGVHLPLTRKAEAQPGKTGTRHAAALGLSEVSDALILVVSEENGAISIAESAKISQVGLTELQDRIADTVRPRLAASSGGRWRSVWPTITRQAGALLASFLLWLTFVSPGEAEIRHVDLPISLERLPTQFFTDTPKPEIVKAAIVGTQDSFGHWLPQARTIIVDLKGASPGENVIALDRNNLKLPLGLRLRKIEPSSITIKLHRTREIFVAVAPKMAGRQPAATAVPIVVKPNRIPLLVREGDPGPAVVTTEPFDYAALLQTGKLSVKLLTPTESFRTSTTPEFVELSIALPEPPATK